MNKEENLHEKLKQELIEEIIECNSTHKNCDFLLEHFDCDILTEIFEENKQLKERIDKYKNVLESFKRWLQIEVEIKCKNEYVVPFEIALDKLLELEKGDINE